MPEKRASFRALMPSSSGIVNANGVCRTELGEPVPLVGLVGPQGSAKDAFQHL